MNSIKIKHRSKEHKYYIKNTIGITNNIETNDYIFYCVYTAIVIKSIIPYYKASSFIEICENKHTKEETILSQYGNEEQIKELKQTYFIS